ncbi:MAG: response regulator [Bacteroidales bacterium]|nr:response regulator [Bacteroidales bacterium]
MDRKAIICVDDESIILDSLYEQLEKNFGDDYIYEIAESAEEALEIIDDLEDDGIDIAIIVCDWLMPGMKGDKFLLQVDLKYPRVVKILLTGQADQNSVDTLAHLADQFKLVAKPWNKDELINVIKAELSKNE